MTDFAKFLYDYMDEHNMSIAALARKLDCSTSIVCQWLHRGSAPSLCNRVLIAETFGYTLDEFDKQFFSDKQLAPRSPNVFADALVQRTAKNEVNFAALADKINVRSEHVYGWALGRFFPEARHIPILAKALNMDVVECANLLVIASAKANTTRMARILRVLRYALGLYSSDVCKMIGVGNASYIRWETGNADVRESTACKLANWLHTTRDYVHEAFKDNNPDNADLQELKKLYNSVTSYTESNKLGEFIVNYLNENGVTINEFANHVGCDLDTINRWIDIGEVPSIPMCTILAKEFGYTVDEFEKELLSDKNVVKHTSNKFVEALINYSVTNGVKQVDMCNKAGIGSEKLSFWMKGVNYPRAHSVHNIAIMLDMSDLECAYLIVMANTRDLKSRMSCILKVLRYSFNLNAREISNELGISHTSWVNWETKNRVPAKSCRDVLLKWLHVTEEYMLEAFCDNDPNSLELEEVEKLYNNIKKTESLST